jgi:hypothetical protein
MSDTLITEQKTGDAGGNPPAKAEPAPAAAAPAAAPAEVKYEFKLPDGYAKESAAEVEKFAREHKISPEAAQKLLEREHGISQSVHQKNTEAFAAARSKWVDAVKNDKEIGGQAFDASLKAAKNFLAKYGSDELKNALDASGLGDHPELIRIFARAGKAMSDDKFHDGKQGSDKPKPRDLASIIYGSKSQG